VKFYKIIAHFLLLNQQTCLPVITISVKFCLSCV